MLLLVEWGEEACDKLRLPELNLQDCKLNSVGVIMSMNGLVGHVLSISFNGLIKDHAESNFGG